MSSSTKWLLAIYIASAQTITGKVECHLWQGETVLCRRRRRRKPDSWDVDQQRQRRFVPNEDISIGNLWWHSPSHVGPRQGRLSLSLSSFYHPHLVSEVGWRSLLEFITALTFLTLSYQEPSSMHSGWTCFFSGDFFLKAYFISSWTRPNIIIIFLWICSFI